MARSRSAPSRERTWIRATQDGTASITPGAGGGVTSAYALNLRSSSPFLQESAFTLARTRGMLRMVRGGDTGNNINGALVGAVLPQQLANSAASVEDYPNPFSAESTSGGDFFLMEPFSFPAGAGIAGGASVDDIIIHIDSKAQRIVKASEAIYFYICYTAVGDVLSTTLATGLVLSLLLLE